MPSVDPPPSPARRIAPWLALVALAALLFEAVYPRILARVLPFGSPVPFYAYSSRDMLAFALRCIWVAGLAWTAGLMLLRVDAEAEGRGLPWRATAVDALRRVPLLVFAVVLRGAVAMLVAVPAALILGAGTTRVPGSGAAIAGSLLVVATGLWVRLALVEPAALLDSPARPIAASWAGTGRRLGPSLLITGLAWLPVLAEAAIPAALKQPPPMSAAEIVLVLAPRLAWAPYTVLAQAAPPASAVDWVLAGLRWACLAGYLVVLTWTWRGFRRNAPRRLT